MGSDREKRLRRKLQEAEKGLAAERKKRTQAEVVLHVHKELLDALTDGFQDIACGIAFDCGRTLPAAGGATSENSGSA